MSIDTTTVYIKRKQLSGEPVILQKMDMEIHLCRRAMKSNLQATKKKSN